MSENSAVDLRSDTVTRPTPAMRAAIASAVVGDDVFGDDPTVKELERRVAALAGKEAALYVPSGTMGNQLAVNALTTPGDEVLLESQSHVMYYEQGGIAANSGCLAHVVAGERGVIPVEALVAAVRPYEDDHVPRLSTVPVERLADDHARAKTLAEGMRAAGVRVTEPDTNIVFAHLDRESPAPERVIAGLESRGVRMAHYGGGCIRAICHLDVDDAGVARAIEAFREVVSPKTAAAR